MHRVTGRIKQVPLFPPALSRANRVETRSNEIEARFSLDEFRARFVFDYPTRALICRLSLSQPQKVSQLEIVRPIEMRRFAMF